MFTTKEIDEIFEKCSGLRILIIGDVMVDSYLWGKVDRISPEAPVPVVSLTRRENRPGGAANVALNVQALGATPVLCSVIGNDMHGDQFMQLLAEQRLEGNGILRSEERITTTKFRIIGNNAHMLRVDEETDAPISNQEADALFDLVAAQVDAGADAIIFEDYDKGVLTNTIIQRIIELAQSRNLPVVVDPKKRNFLSYGGATFFKPNLKELREGLKIDHLRPSQKELDAVLGHFMDDQSIEMVMVTLSEAGVYLCHRDAKGLQSHLIPAHLRKIADVSGAGDSVIALCGIGLALGLTPLLMAALANLAGGLVCEEVGVVPVNKERLYHEALLKLTTNG